MKRLRSVGIAAIAFSCATAAPPSTQKRASEEVRTSSARGGESPGMGYFPLPRALSADPTKVPIPKLDFKVRKPERISLENGLTLYLAQDHTSPLVELRAMIAAGSVDDPAEKLGLAQVTFSLLSSSGTKELTADALDELLEFHAADAHSSASEEFSVLEQSLRSQDLEKLFPVFVEMLLRPRFQKDRFDISIARTMESIRRRPDNPDGLALRALRKAVFGAQSPFGRESTEKTLRGISLAEVRKFHQRAVVPKATSLLITGDFERDPALRLIREHLDAWKGGEKLERHYPPEPELKRRVIFVPKDIAQAKIRIGGHGFVRLSPMEHAMRVMNAAVGGGFGVARLYREVRGVRGLAYSTFSVVSPGPTSGLFYAGADTKPATAVEATEAMLEIFRDVEGSRPLSAEEISIAADLYLNSFVFNFDSPAKIAFQKALFDINGYPEQYLDQYRDKIAQVTVSSALEAAKAILKLDQMQIVVVGPAGKVGDLSRFGPVTTVKDVQAFQ